MFEKRIMILEHDDSDFLYLCSSSLPEEYLERANTLNPPEHKMELYFVGILGDQRDALRIIRKFLKKNKIETRPWFPKDMADSIVELIKKESKESVFD